MLHVPLWLTRALAPLLYFAVCSLAAQLLLCKKKNPPVCVQHKDFLFFKITFCRVSSPGYIAVLNAYSSENALHLL